MSFAASAGLRAALTFRAHQVGAQRVFTITRLREGRRLPEPHRCCRDCEVTRLILDLVRISGNIGRLRASIEDLARERATQSGTTPHDMVGG